MEALVTLDDTSITPPGRPAHAFTYLPKGQLQFYWAPQPLPPLAEPRTRYDYYLDGELARITRPDGQQINFTTDPETGQLLAQRGTLVGAQYDDQDRLLALDVGPSTLDFSYAANGKLLSCGPPTPAG